MDLVRVLETYRGHDRIIRLSTYVCMFVSGDRKGLAFDRIRAIATDLSACRVILRLFDDLPMLFYNLFLRNRSKEKSTLLRILNLLTNIINQSFYPVEHIAWLADKQVINTDSKKWWVLGVMVWALSLVAEILKQLVSISLISRKLKQTKKQQYLESTDEREESIESTSTEAKALKDNLLEARLSLLSSSSDFLNAINWCPPGVLWAGKLSRSWSGVFGILSTSIMLYKNWPKKS
ncbi:PEX11C [Mytilus edulis]|uniref:PEX11C n=1 Tax=Mytilus edulis TaxID=6550 RepID=A0A8S3QC93_MYTED|nr:PEX11C [Mytilus edulis]